VKSCYKRKFARADQLEATIKKMLYIIYNKKNLWALGFEEGVAIKD
jgi:hypothetical protein